MLQQKVFSVAINFFLSCSWFGVSCAIAHSILLVVSQIRCCVPLVCPLTLHDVATHKATTNQGWRSHGHSRSRQAVCHTIRFASIIIGGQYGTSGEGNQYKRKYCEISGCEYHMMTFAGYLKDISENIKIIGNASNTSNNAFF